MPGGSGGQANEVIVDPTTGSMGTIWVDLRAAGMVYAVDGATNTIIGGVQVGCAPYGMAIVGRHLYVVNHSSSLDGCDPGNASVSVVNMDTRTEIVRIPLPSGSEPTFADTDSSGRVFVGLHWSTGHSLDGRQAAVIQDSSMSVLGYVTKDPSARANDGWGLATDPAGGFLYIGTRNGATVSKWSLSNVFGSPVGRIQPGGNVFFVQVNKTTGDLYIVHTGAIGSERPANIMKRYDRSGFTLANSTISGLDTFDGGGIAINRNNQNRLYVAGTDYTGPTDLFQTVWQGLGYSSSAPYRLAPAQGIQPDPLGVGVNENTYRIYVANRGNNTLTVIEDTQYKP